MHGQHIFSNKYICSYIRILFIGHKTYSYLICERKGAVNVQPVISLQLQQRVSQQLLKEQRER